MKKNSLFLFITLCVNVTFAKFNNNFIIKPYVYYKEIINVIFENNSTSKGIKKFKLTIVDQSGSKRTEEISMSEDSRRKTLSLNIGSSVYVANSAALNTLVGGKAPSKDAPLMTVKMRDKNQTIHLVEEVNAKESDVLANAAKSAAKLKLASDVTISYIVTGNTVTVYYRNNKGKIIAEFDCDKKNGAVKNINDLRKIDDQGPVVKSTIAAIKNN
jgi:ABC-type uncharacterized transport system permease subunit